MAAEDAQQYTFGHHTRDDLNQKISRMWSATRRGSWELVDDAAISMTSTATTDQ